MRDHGGADGAAASGLVFDDDGAEVILHPVRPHPAGDIDDAARGPGRDHADRIFGKMLLRERRQGAAGNRCRSRS